MQHADAQKRRFTTDDYHAMGRAGILSERDRVELIDGEILDMTPIGPAHAAAVDRAADVLMRHVRPHAIVRVQGPIRLDALSEPQPDITLLRPPADSYRNAHPQPADVLLVVEIADSSLRYDRDVKASLYARHAIVEFWLVDLAGGTVHCHTSPHAETYSKVTVRTGGELVAPTTLPDCVISVDDLL